MLIVGSPCGPRLWPRRVLLLQPLFQAPPKEQVFCFCPYEICPLTRSDAVGLWWAETQVEPRARSAGMHSDGRTNAENGFLVFSLIPVKNLDVLHKNLGLWLFLQNEEIGQHWVPFSSRQSPSLPPWSSSRALQMSHGPSG